MREIPIKTAYITLDQLLKWGEVCTTGGEAKILIAEGAVQVNGEVEQRRGRKLHPGDVVVLAGRDPLRVTGEEG